MNKIQDPEFLKEMENYEQYKDSPFCRFMHPQTRMYAAYVLKDMYLRLKDPTTHFGYPQSITLTALNLSFLMDRVMEWDKWRKEIPELSFPSDWKIKIVPPFAGAVVRFTVEKNDHWVSVYLDCYDVLGSMNKPYWEIYPSEDGDTSRFDMNDTEGLLKEIAVALESDKTIKEKEAIFPASDPSANI